MDAGKPHHEDTKHANGANENKVVQSASERWLHPRWVRINTIKTDLEEQIRTTFAGFKQVDSISQLLEDSSDSSAKIIHVDKHIPNLVALSPAINLSKTLAYRTGLIILQDKASCFPAYLLNPEPKIGQVLDACAAPGNKTTHLAAIVQEKDATNKLRVYACERDKARAVTLGKMLQTAGVSGFVSVRAGQDFLRLDPDQAPWNDVGYLLLDPSCSGSGMITRHEELTVMLPDLLCTEPSTSHPRKRKRKLVSPQSPDLREIQEEVAISNDKGPNQLSDRLSALSTFQLKMLVHAFHFPKARRVAYSTCSIYAEENEHVVVKALSSEIATNRGWRILPRGQQVSGMRDWQLRGDHQACTAVADTTAATEEVAKACIRCEKGTQEGTQGFFVAAFVRDAVGGTEEQTVDEEWEGFSDQEHLPGK